MWREPTLVQTLVQLMNSSSPEVQYQATLTLKNLAADGEWQLPTPKNVLLTSTTEHYRLEIVKANGLDPLLHLLQSLDFNSVFAAVLCVCNLTLQPTNDSEIIEAGFLRPLADFLAFKDSETIQLNAVKALRNLAASTEKNRWAIVDTGAVESIKELIMEVPVNVQIEMTHCIETLSSSGMHSPFNRFFYSHPPPDDLKFRLQGTGIVEVLILLTESPNVEVQRRSGAALRNFAWG